MGIKIGLGLIICKETGEGSIERLRVQGIFDSASQLVARADIVNDIESNDSHYHPLFAPEGSKNMDIGPKVHVVTIGGKKYLRTDRNDTPEDNLGELPECQ